MRVDPSRRPIQVPPKMRPCDRSSTMLGPPVCPSGPAADPSRSSQPAGPPQRARPLRGTAVDHNEIIVIGRPGCRAVSDEVARRLSHRMRPVRCCCPLTWRRRCAGASDGIDHGTAHRRTAGLGPARRGAAARGCVALASQPGNAARQGRLVTPGFFRSWGSTDQPNGRVRYRRHSCRSVALVLPKSPPGARK